MPQMMKAHLTKASLSIDITPDSLDHELSGLKTWVAEEKDPVYKAILHHLLGYYTLDTGKRDEAAIDAAIAYFRLSPPADGGIAPRYETSLGRPPVSPEGIESTHPPLLL